MAHNQPLSSSSYRLDDTEMPDSPNHSAVSGDLILFDFSGFFTSLDVHSRSHAMQIYGESMSMSRENQQGLSNEGLETMDTPRGELSIPTQRSIPRITLTEPSPPSSSHTSEPWRQTHSWIEPGPVTPQPPRSPFIVDDQYDLSPPVVPPPSQLRFVPRPVEDYKAMLQAMETGNFIVPVFGASATASQHVSGAGTIQQTPGDVSPSASVQPDQGTTSALVSDSAARQLQSGPRDQWQMQPTAKKRRRTESPPVPAPLSSKRIRAAETEPKAPSSLNYSRVAKGLGDTASLDNNALQPTLSAAHLIGNRKTNTKHKYALPWGLKRILTQAFVEKQAVKMQIPIPPILDEDIRIYCQSDRTFDPLLSVFPPKEVDIRFLGNIELTAEELLAFFPNHLKWNDAIYRLAQNGWSCSDMAAYLNYVRGLNSNDGRRSNTLLKWIQVADKAILGLDKSGSTNRKPWKTTGFQAVNWVPFPRQEALIDYPLVDLADGIVRWPEGDGARLLTRAVRHAVAHGHRDVMFSHIHEYIRENLLIFPPLQSMFGQMMEGVHPDVAANERIRPVLRDHRNAVSAQKKAETAKRAAEA